MGFFSGYWFRSKRKDQNQTIFCNEEEVKNFFRDWNMKEILNTEEQRSFVENMFLHYLNDSDHGIQVREIEENILPLIAQHANGNPLSFSDFQKLKKKFLSL